ncbi:MerR family transcriptional regulator [Candidatus Omnitrophota bacterium]
MRDIYLVKDLARLSGQSVHTIKYYLKIALIKEVGRCPETRFRYFNSSTLERLLRIRQLRKLNRPIREIKERLD